MLSTLRDLTKKWWVRLPLGLLVLSFGLWGINDVFSGQRRTSLATVDGRDIDGQEYLRQLKQIMERQTGPDGQAMTLADAHASGLDRRVLEDVIDDAAVLNEADRLGITASDAMVRDAVNGISALQGLDGKLDRERLIQALQHLQLSEQQFVDQMRMDIVREQLLQTAVIGTPGPRGLALSIMAYQNERRAIEYVVLPADKAGAIAAPDDAALQTYLDTHKDKYTTPELRSITLIALSPEDLMPKMTVSDDEVKKVYDDDKSRFEIPETRDLQQIIYLTQQAAEVARKELDSGKTFEDLLTAQKMTAKEAALGTVRKGDSSVPPEAFTIKEGEVTPAVQGPFGWVLIKVVKVTGGSTTPFETVKGKIHDGLAREKALAELSTISNQMNDATSSTDSLDDVAKQLKLDSPRKIAALDAKGNDADGKPIDKLPDGAAFLTDVFSTGEGQKSFVGETPKHTIYVFTVDKVAAPALPPVAQIHGKLATAWTTDEQAKKLDTMASDAVKSANAGTGTADDIAKVLGLTAKTSAPIARDAKSDDLSPGLIEALFATKKGIWIAGDGTVYPNRVIARVKDVATQTSAKPEQDFAKTIQQVSQTIGEEYATTYRDAIRATAKVTINQQMFNQLTQSANE